MTEQELRDEITRLKSSLQASEKQAERLLSTCETNAKSITSKDAEIARLKAENEALEKENADCLKKAVAAMEPLAIAYCDIRDLKAENERLQSLLSPTHEPQPRRDANSVWVFKPLNEAWMTWKEVMGDGNNWGEFANRVKAALKSISFQPQPDENELLQIIQQWCHKAYNHAGDNWQKTYFQEEFMNWWKSSIDSIDDDLSRRKGGGK